MRVNGAFVRLSVAADGTSFFLDLLILPLAWWHAWGMHGACMGHALGMNVACMRHACMHAAVCLMHATGCMRHESVSLSVATDELVLLLKLQLLLLPSVPGDRIKCTTARGMHVCVSLSVATDELLLLLLLQLLLLPNVPGDRIKCTAALGKHVCVS